LQNGIWCEIKKRIRTSLNISQKELLEQTGLTLRTIQGIENNEVKPSLYSLKDIGEVLKCDLSEFVKTSETKAYEFNVNLKITDMNQFLNCVFRTNPASDSGANPATFLDEELG
jgi:transcriptional regulator with XRE-family HTH domain